MKLTYEAILNDPSLLERIQAQARRERSKAINRLIVQPIRQFFASDAPRAHLARQG